MLADGGSGCAVSRRVGIRVGDVYPRRPDISERQGLLSGPPSGGLDSMVVACAIGAGGVKVKPYGRPAADLDPASSTTVGWRR